MFNKNLKLIVILILFSYSNCFTQNKVLFKQIDTTKLYLEVFYPDDFDQSKNYPAMLFFFGGGWNSGSTDQFKPHANYFSKRGIVCFLVDYRVKSAHHTTPFESLKDAKSAIRFIRKKATDFGISPEKIIASGGSAGGHLAAATALIENYNESSDEIEICCVPNALVLFNPVIDNGPGGYGFERIGSEYRQFSPLHNIKSGAPPTIIFLGTNDKLIPVETAEYYKKVMEKVSSRCELELYEGQGHGFFNYRQFEYYKKTVTKADMFLQSIGFIEKKTKLIIE